MSTRELYPTHYTQAPSARPSFASLVPTLQEAEAIAAGASARPVAAAITATLRVRRPGGGAVEERIQVRWRFSITQRATYR